MRIQEDEAKEVLRSYGIRSPDAITVSSPDEAVAYYNTSSTEVVIKPLGLKKRGKAGLVVFARDARETEEACQKMLGMEVEGTKISKLLVAEKINVAKELYAAISIDYSAGRAVLVLSQEGGVDIEETGKKSPEKIKKIPLSLVDGVDAQAVGSAIADFPIQNKQELITIIQKLYEIFRKYDAETLEINPLAVDRDGRLVAIDAFIDVNDDSLSRHPELAHLKEAASPSSDMERQMREQGWSYVELGGDLGIICSGAGLSMATLDLVQSYGGRPANFLDMAQVDGEGIYRALEILSKKEGLGCIFVHLFAGLNRCDNMAEGVKRFVSLNKPKFPLVVRMVGNREDEGAAILKEAGIDNIRSLEIAARTAAQVKNDGKPGR